MCSGSPASRLHRYRQAGGAHRSATAGDAAPIPEPPLPGAVARPRAPGELGDDRRPLLLGLGEGLRFRPALRGTAPVVPAVPSPGGGDARPGHAGARGAAVITVGVSCVSPPCPLCGGGSGDKPVPSAPHHDGLKSCSASAPCVPSAQGTQGTTRPDGGWRTSVAPMNGPTSPLAQGATGDREGTTRGQARPGGGGDLRKRVCPRCPLSGGDR